MTPEVRRARIEDAAALARLSGELGYPAAESQIRRRLEALVERPEHAVFVTETSSREVAGWLHVCLSHHLESDTFAELAGLVVGESQRSSGLGALLVREAEAWARAAGVREIRVRSNVVRERAHRFYLREGFRTIKTQAVLSKPLD